MMRDLIIKLLEILVRPNLPYPAFALCEGIYGFNNPITEALIDQARR